MTLVSVKAAPRQLMCSVLALTIVYPDVTFTYLLCQMHDVQARHVKVNHVFLATAEGGPSAHRFLPGGFKKVKTHILVWQFFLSWCTKISKHCSQIKWNPLSFFRPRMHDLQCNNNSFHLCATLLIAASQTDQWCSCACNTHRSVFRFLIFLSCIFNQSFEKCLHFWNSNPFARIMIHVISYC